MLLKKVVIENYGLYGGRHEFDLVPRKRSGKECSIVLLGGKNGAGKTTLLDAVRLTLYGRSSLGPGISETAYTAFLRDRIHRPKTMGLAPSEARLSIEFDFVASGNLQTYRVERAWSKVNAAGVDHSFKVYRDGTLLRDIETNQWESFIADIVPERLSQLYFFDGEKIKSMAEDVSGSSAAKEAIHSLLGLDIVDRLIADLSLYVSANARELATDKELQILGEQKTQLREIGQQQDALGARLAEVKAQRATLQQKVCGLEEMDSLSKQKTEQRAQAIASTEGAKETIEATKKKLQDEAASLFPIGLCPSVATALLEQLDGEGAAKQSIAVSEALTELENNFFDMLTGSKKMPNADKTTVQRIFQLAAASIAVANTPAPLVHDLSTASEMRMRSTLDEATTKSIPRVNRLAAELEEAYAKLRQTELDNPNHASESKGSSDNTKSSKLEPGEDEIKLLMAQDSDLARDAGALEAQQAALGAQHSQLQRAREKVEISVHKKSKKAEIIVVVSRVQAALREYKSRLTSKKLQTLEHAVTESFNNLARKEDVIEKIRVNPETFDVELLDHRGRSVAKDELSSGEKQIYAVAFLWGLARTSGRPLPVIIDTPLGRLDSDHRKNLIERYFPYAGHQVILLSTDTEVDQGFFKKLSPHVSHCYHLVYEGKEGRTVPREEYFWKEPVDA